MCGAPYEREVAMLGLHSNGNEHRRRRRHGWAGRTLATVVALSVGTACGSGSGGVEMPGQATAEAEAGSGEVSEGDGRPALCARDRDDAVRAVFCAQAPPRIRGLQDLLDALGFELPTGPRSYTSMNVAVTGHSTALSGHKVSPINPRLIMAGPTFSAYIGSPIFIAYQRGVQKVELIAGSFKRDSLNFYRIQFQQACNAAPEGCSPGQLYTPQVERDWLSWTIDDDEDLKNTPDDCRQCHQRGEGPVLLMRELNNPWTHFFQPIRPDTERSDLGPGVLGRDLAKDYLEAKGDEAYGGFAMAALEEAAPYLLESAVGIRQPVFFDAPKIENERWPYDPDGGYPSEPGPSPTWEAAYAAFKRGEQLALPYLEPRATDPGKQAQLSEAYGRYRAGDLSAEELPDLADVFPDDPLVRARIGLQTEPGADAVDTLIQGCGSCHNDVLDQSISRADFNVNLWQLDGTAIERAIERIELPPEAEGAMPPPEARQLDLDGRSRLLDYLRKDPLAREPEPRLVHAAERGMAGGGGGGSVR